MSAFNEAPRRLRLRPWLSVLAAVCLALTVAACGDSTKSGPTDTANASNASAGSAGAGGKVIVVGIPPTNAFGTVVKKGADDAAKATGANYEWVAPANFDNLVPDFTRLLNDSIARKPAAIAFIDLAPATFNPIIKKAVASGIDFVIFNSGLSEWQKIGAIGYAGEDPVTQGRAAGQQLVAAGAKKVMCWNHIGTLEVELRCKGVEQVVKAAGGSVAVFNTPIADSSNEASLTQDVQGYLQSHKDIQGVIAAGSNIAIDTVTAAKNINRSGLVIGSTDLSTEVANAVADGRMAFSIDQQPYLQGYYAVQLAAQYAKYGLRPTTAVNTGGLVVDKSNAQQALDVQKQYGTVRGPEH